jgi:outer membrane biosynthesis protein TonB
MSDHDRGAYTPPTDAPLSFDARQPVRGSRPLPFTLIVSVLVLAALVVAIFLFYRSGVREAGQPPQTVGQPVGELKSPPTNEAQPQDPAAGLQIYRSESGQPAEAVPAAPAFTPPPEQPQARPAPAPMPASPPPAAVPTTPVGPPQPLRPAAPPSPVQPPAPGAPLPVTRLAPPPAPTAKTTPAPAKPAPKTIDQAIAAAATPKAAAGGAAGVQIGAFSSPSLADKGWSDAVSISPGLAAGKGKSVEKVERDGSTFYRTTVTGFASRADAAAFCAALKGAGKACFVR